MKKLLIIWVFIVAFFLSIKLPVLAVDQINLNLPPSKCYLNGCPSDLLDVYKTKGEKCVYSYEDFVKDPGKSHFWIDDPQVTSQGRADERARQFVYWVLNKNAIDDRPILKEIWNTTRNISYFFVILMTAIIGLGFIIGQKTNFNLNIKVMPWLMKIALSILFITFSAALIIVLIQLSETMSRFFVDRLGGNRLFNIYFSDIPSSEKNYTDFIGCRDLNYQVQEAVDTEIFLLKATNVTYYVMGIMLILRKIILWSMIFVSPFLAILFPFTFIRNIGWIWIGVFFQWLFYGPLFSLFLGATARIWQSGIPFIFNFSRTNSSSGYIYPSGINIIYGGPAQTLAMLNNGSYIDTFVEYIISLLMLWVAVLFPWWLLRIFRDYCCDGINTSKNILMSIYDNLRGGSSPTPGAAPALTLGKNFDALKASKNIELNIQTKFENLEQVKRVTTEEIRKTINTSTTTSKLTNIANYETNSKVKETTNKNISVLQNPANADTPTQKQVFMNIKNELYNRSLKNDQIAKQMLMSVSGSYADKVARNEQILNTIPKAQTVSYIVSYKSKINPEKVVSANNFFIESISKNSAVVSQLSQANNVSNDQTQAIFTALKQNVNKPATEILASITKDTNLTTDKVIATLKAVSESLKNNDQLSQSIKEAAASANLQDQDLQKLLQEQIELILESQQNVEKTITIPATVSLEDYEQVKRMWKEQYEKGEVPVSENIKTRSEWIEKDIVFITNTLNKLVSSNVEIKTQGLDDLAYILPVFLINNLKGEEIIVYLKAKLEAAKSVKEEKEVESAAVAKTKEEMQNQEEFVDVKNVKKEENTKTMQISEELPPILKKA